MGAYLRREARARSTGAMVEVFDTAHEANVFDSDAGRWVTYCVTHDRICNHRALSDALYYSSHPEVWCEVCNGSEVPEVEAVVDAAPRSDDVSLITVCLREEVTYGEWTYPVGSSLSAHRDVEGRVFLFLDRVGVARELAVGEFVRVG